MIVSVDVCVGVVVETVDEVEKSVNVPKNEEVEKRRRKYRGKEKEEDQEV